MTPATNPSIEGESIQKTVARIDAQDESFIIPVRDFLSSFGCETIVNRPSSAPVDYHIVCGDNWYVKQIFSSLAISAGKRLVISMDVTAETFEEIPPFTKVVFFEPGTLTVDDIERMFQFFFTSQTLELDLRKNPKKHVRADSIRQPNHMPHVKQESQEEERVVMENDTKRINDIVQSLFSPQTSKKKRSKKIGTRLWRGVVLFFVLSPFLWYCMSIALGTLTVGYAAFLVRSGKVQSASAVSRFARFWVDQGDQALRVIGQPIRLVSEESVYGQERYLSLLSHIAAATNGVSSVFATGKTLAGQLLSRAGDSETSGSPAREVAGLRTELFSVQNHVGLAQSELHALIESSSFPFWFAATKRLGQRGEDALARYRHSISSVDKFLLLYPRMTGFREKQVYLVLLQNSTELRPTGGFIGSIARVSVEDGRMSDLEVSDVYVVDGQLKGHVDPPIPIRELLGQEHWYLRDSNWDPDFSRSAAQAAWFYEKETGVRVDGVIGISTPFIVDLLALTGPLTLIDYNDRITSQNFYGKSLFYTQEDFFPGSTQKKDFLGSLTGILLDELTTSKTLNPVGVFRTLTDALERRDVLFYFTDPELQSMVTQFGWSGNIFPVSACAGVSGTCLSDPLMVVEANLGVNKANYFVGRQLTRTIRVEQDGGVKETITLTLENSSRGRPDDSGGVYRSYIRYLLPPDASVSYVRLSGVNVPLRDTKQLTPPSLPYAEYADKPGMLGVAVEIPASGAEQLTLEYSRGAKLQIGPDGATYELFMQKQSGVSDTPIEVIVEYPVFWEAKLLGDTPQAFLAKEGRLEYNTILSQDKLIRFQFFK